MAQNSMEIVLGVLPLGQLVGRRRKRRSSFSGH